MNVYEARNVNGMSYGLFTTGAKARQACVDNFNLCAKDDGLRRAKSWADMKRVKGFNKRFYKVTKREVK